MMAIIQKYGYILLIIFLCTAFTVAGVLKKSQTDNVVEITISDGDSLWVLAQQYGENERPGKWVDKVMVLNNMETTMIKTGETLKLPASEPVQDMLITELAGEE